MHIIKAMNVLHITLPVPKGLCLKAGEKGHFTRMCDRKRGNSLKQEKVRVNLDIRKKFLNIRWDEALEEVAQRHYELPIPGGVQV